jgi:uncharacterized membrane protein YeaQ/YmgE (transglycosylase-associated protein family)
MIEILVLVQFVRRLAAIAEEKGRAKSWGALGVAGWIGGEVLGGIVAALLGADGAGLYGIAILCAIVGSVIAYTIVKNLRPGGMVAAYAEYGTTTAPAPNYDPNNPYNPPRAG